MLFQCKITGTSPLIMHSTAGMDPFSDIAIQRNAITKKRGSNRTPADEAKLRQLECLAGLYIDAQKRPTLPTHVIRSCIEGGARKLKEGPQMREGLFVRSTDKFEYDKKRYGTSLESLAKKTQFTADVRVSRARIMRTRPKFDEWGVTFSVDADDELVDRDRLERWLEIAGRRVGIGDWRPACSGTYGMFRVDHVKEVREVVK